MLTNHTQSATFHPMRQRRHFFQRMRDTRLGSLAISVVVGGLCATLGALWLGSAPALAAEEEHPYIAEHSLIDQVAPEASACGVVTDSHGDIYVTNYSKQLVLVYSPSNVKLAEFKVKFTNGPCNLAVDSTGAVYVEEYSGQVDKYKPSVFPPTSGATYALEESAGTKGVIVAKSGKAHAIAVDPANQDLYVAAEKHISSYEPNGKLLSSTMGEGLFTEPNFYGVDVYGANGNVYVTERGKGRVFILNPSGTSISREITGAGSPAGAFEPSGFLENLTVDQSSGDFYVYCISGGPGAAYEFNPAGGYLSKIGPSFDSTLSLHGYDGADVAVDNGSSSPNRGDAYITSEDQLHEADSVFAFGPSVEYQLKVKNEDTSAGTVTSEPAGIECGSICSAEFTKGETIELKAEPKTGFVFAGWSGACSGEGTCSVAMGEVEGVTVAWKVAGHPKLKVDIGGEGTVTSEPAGIECGGACEAAFEEGSVVTLKAKASGGSKFVGWTGCTSLSNQTECTVTMSEAHTATATFEKASGPQLLKIEKEGPGEGTISSIPSGIECGPTGPTCEASFAEGEKVTLKAVQTLGSKFTGWTGCTLLVSQTECTVTMTEAHTVKAAFALASHYLLQVKTTGTGAGSVTGPSGIACPSTCTASFEEGTMVTLEAKPEPAAGYVSIFTGWSGACTGTATTCKVSMSEARTVTATFERGTIQYPLKVLDAGTGQGTVSSSQLGVDCGLVCSGPINCGPTCEASIEAGTTVELIAIPAAGSIFTGWSGVCFGLGNCQVTMSEAQNVTATFEPITPSKYALQVTKAGEGAGTITSIPAGINCGPTCQASYEAGTNIELIAAPEPGYTFTGWSGACIGTETVCLVTMSEARTVTATFTTTKTSLPPVETQSGGSATTAGTTSAGTGATKPPPPGVGLLTLPSVGMVKGSEASLVLRCSTAGPCDGALKLTITLKQGHKTKTLVIGRASYSISAGGSQTIKIALSSLAKGLLRHKSLRATLTGAGVHSTLALESHTRRG